MSALATNLLKSPEPLIPIIPLIIVWLAKANIIEITTRPTTLNMTWINAVLLAFLLAFIAAITAGETMFSEAISSKLRC